MYKLYTFDNSFEIKMREVRFTNNFREFIIINRNLIITSTKLLQNAARNNARRKKKKRMNRRFCVYVPSFRILCFKNGSKLKTRGPMVL